MYSDLVVATASAEAVRVMVAPPLTHSGWQAGRQAGGHGGGGAAAALAAAIYAAIDATSSTRLVWSAIGRLAVLVVLVALSCSFVVVMVSPTVSVAFFPRHNLPSIGRRSTFDTF
jgi:hypothetical protein